MALSPMQPPLAALTVASIAVLKLESEHALHISVKGTALAALV